MVFQYMNHLFLILNLYQKRNFLMKNQNIPIRCSIIFHRLWANLFRKLPQTLITCDCLMLRSHKPKQEWSSSFQAYSKRRIEEKRVAKTTQIKNRTKLIGSAKISLLKIKMNFSLKKKILKLILLSLDLSHQRPWAG